MKKYILFLFAVTLCLSATAQTFIQQGKVVDETGDPIIGVTVIVKGTSTGTASDIDGDFSLSVPHKSTLVFSFIGYENQEYKADSTKNFVKITLKPDHATLDEVVVVGYGTVKKSMVTGSVSSIKGIGVSSKRSPSAKTADYKSAKIDKSKVGLLTAGELNDFSKWAMWDSIANKVMPNYRDQWQILPQERYVAQLTNEKGMPIVNAKVTLTDATKKPIWETKTDNTGRAELWANIYKQGAKQTTSSIHFEYNGNDTTISARPFSEGINAVSLAVACNTTKNVDIMMIIDATGSMSDEMTYLQNELHDIISQVNKKQSGLDIHIGSVVYRDHGDEYLTRKTSLDKDISKTIDFIQGQRAGGGGDYPEAVDEALYQSIELENWREDALTRIAFLVLDAPAHNNAEVIQRLQQQITLAAQKGIRIIPIACSGTNKETEYLMRSMALATNGTYVFLTDDSGIGDAHIKPSTDKYDVESLNNLMTRLILQYTQMPDCDNSDWEKEYKKEQETDKFVSNPYDSNPEEDVSKLTTNKVMKVYPNPCSDILKIDIKKKVKDVFVVDISGKSLLKFNPSEGETINTDISGYSAGVYFVKAYYKGRWFTEKIIIR